MPHRPPGDETRRTDQEDDTRNRRLEGDLHARSAENGGVVVGGVQAVEGEGLIVLAVQHHGNAGGGDAVRHHPPLGRARQDQPDVLLLGEVQHVDDVGRPLDLDH
ncbi:hypothetical protein D3C73_1226320 [compost metagenome]